MTTLTGLRREMDALNKKRDDLKNEELNAIGRKMIRCVGCGERSQLSAWIFIQDMWYVRPYSCTGGAYWRHHETRTCYMRCPKCGNEMYINNDPQRDKIVELVDSVPSFLKEEIFVNDIEKRTNLSVNIFAVNDEDIYDPENKVKNW